MVWTAVWPPRDVDVPWALEMLASQQQSNHAAYLSHRTRRIALVIRRE
jgi:hypothetical protein